jgi:4-hydroxy-2-oxoheptanedioate aldolase
MTATSSRFHDLLRPGAAAWCVNPGGASLDVVDMLAAVGVRSVFIDCERTAIHIESVTALVRCAHSHGMAAMLRSETPRPEILVRYLDRGIDALVVPHTETVSELAAIGEVVDYAARGGRERVAAIAQIESRAAVDNVQALAACSSVDAFLIGPNDLAHSLGHAGQPEHPEVTAAIDRVAAVLQDRQRTWGLPADAGTASPWARRGAQFLYGTLGQILKAGYAPMAAAAHPTS